MDIKHNLIIKASAATICDAVSTKDGIQGWWSKDCTVGEKEGEKSILKFNKEGNIVEMGFETLKLEPKKKVVWECIENANPAWLQTKISTEISETSEGCTVVFTHGGFDEKWKGHEAFEMTKGGWDHFVQSLVSYCENGAGQPW
ncbi:SRPBCC family protein [Gillisia marina]|uniref:SRPBCC family protein n=1 Tax=Gillisia marina TaxID=1167637 RepID=UPI000299F204|nr:SRPBCC domain-containing protein [Gillisia marina]